MRTLMLAAAAALMVVFTGCKNPTDEIQATREEFRVQSEAWQRQLEKTRKTVEQSVNTMALAVPGERWDRLVDDLYGEDEQKKKRAQDFLKRIAHIDPEMNMRGTVWFRFDEQRGPLRADVFFASLNVPLVLKAHFGSSSYNPAVVHSTIPYPLDQQELEAAIKGDILALYRSMRGTAVPTYTQLDGGYRYKSGAQWSGTILFPTPKPTFRDETDPASWNPNLTDAETQFVNHMLAILRKPSARFVRSAEQQTVRWRPWNPLDGKNFLFIVIPLEDWMRHRHDLEVRTVLHAAGDVTATFDNAAVYKFQSYDFKSTTVSDSGDNAHRVVWAVHNMTESSIFTAETIGSIRALSKVSDEWSKLAPAPASSSAAGRSTK